VKVIRCNLLQELREGFTPPSRRNNPQRSIVEMHLDLTTVLKVELFCDEARDSDGKTVARLENSYPLDERGNSGWESSRRTTSHGIYIVSTTNAAVNLIYPGIRGLMLMRSSNEHEIAVAPCRNSATVERVPGRRPGCSALAF